MTRKGDTSFSASSGLAHVFIDVDGLVRGGVHIHPYNMVTGSSCYSLPEIARAEAPLELLPRVVSMLGVCCLVCGVAMCASSSCGVCELLHAVLCAKKKETVDTAVYPIMV